ncbi:hypothetical protein LTR86_006575 [Recurvomyces mirabilis]|nr:hypothetical protein LTR86_006575 [Recurvomyces mirabilis]
MPELEVPGACLHYEIHGKGPLFLCISGGTGSLEIYSQLAQHLKQHFTVAIYDRRGFSRSVLVGSQDYEHRLETDADDVALLIRHLSPDKPAFVLGNSSGAIVALEALIRHSDVVDKVLVQEPPLISVLPDFRAVQEHIQRVHQIYRKNGVAPAMEQFAAMTKSGAETAALLAAFDPKVGGPYTSGNVMYWLEREFLPYPTNEIDMEALKKYTDKLMLLNCEGTHREALHYRANVVLAEKLDLDLEIMPGGHVGFAYMPEPWARRLVEIVIGS